MNRNPAAVLLGILDNRVVLTRRAAGLRTFTGHVCLPGGQQDSFDSDILNTAIREFNEEVYFNGSIEPILCMLPETSIVSKQEVYPIVANLDGEIKGFNLEEVGRLFFMPLNELSPDKFIINPQYPTIKHNKCLTYDGEFIWGLTAHILYKFAESFKKYFLNY